MKYIILIYAFRKIHKKFKIRKNIMHTFLIKNIMLSRALKELMPQKGLRYIVWDCVYEM